MGTASAEKTPGNQIRKNRVPLTGNGELPIILSLLTDHGHSYTFSLQPGGQGEEKIRANTSPVPQPRPPTLASVTTPEGAFQLNSFGGAQNTAAGQEPPDPIMLICREELVKSAHWPKCADV